MRLKPTENKRNVDALAELIGKSSIPCEDRWEAARSLAELGVLVPSALTDEEIMSVMQADQDYPGSESIVRTELERIAKGEDVA